MNLYFKMDEVTINPIFVWFPRQINIYPFSPCISQLYLANGLWLD
jgi:hypothetical protein